MQRNSVIAKSQQNRGWAATVSENAALTSARTKTSAMQMLNVSGPARIDSSLKLTLMRAEIERQP
jgi:hypothetical protein